MVIWIPSMFISPKFPSKTCYQDASCALALENGRNFGIELPRLFHPMSHEGEVPPLAGASSVGSWASGLEVSPFILNHFPLPMGKKIFMVFVGKLECQRWERWGETPIGTLKLRRLVGCANTRVNQSPSGRGGGRDEGDVWEQFIPRP